MKRGRADRRLVREGLATLAPIRELPSVKVIFEPSLGVFHGGPGKRTKESDPKKILTGDPRAFNEEYQVVYDRLLVQTESEGARLSSPGLQRSGIDEQ